MSDYLKFRQKEPRLRTSVFFIGGSRSQGSEKGPEIQLDPGIS